MNDNFGYGTQGIMWDALDDLSTMASRLDFNLEWVFDFWECREARALWW